MLIEHFISRFNRLQGKDVIGLSREVLAILMEHDYSGNVRELENIIEHAFVLCPGGLIEFHHLPPYLKGKLVHGMLGGVGGASLKSMEKALIAESLRKHNGNRTRAAKDLGIDISTLYRKIKSLKIEVPDKDGRSKRSV